MKDITKQILVELLSNYTVLGNLSVQIEEAFDIMQACYKKGGTILVCGNGGSAADADHIVGELMKGFKLNRKLPDSLRKCIYSSGGVENLADSLQGTIASINLSTHAALVTAIGNDIGYDAIFAQQVLGYGNSNSCLVGISTSGNSIDVINAGIVAKAMEMKTIALTGFAGGKMKQLFDVTINVPQNETAKIQELHLPIYHALCAMLEAEFFAE